MLLIDYLKICCVFANDDAKKMGHLLSAHRAKETVDLLKRETRQRTSSRRHFGLQIVQTSTQSIIKYGMFFSSEFTAGKSKLWTSCDSVSLRNAWERLYQRVIDNAVKQWRRRLRSCVAAKGGHFEQSL